MKHQVIKALNEEHGKKYGYVHFKKQRLWIISY